jgi:transposase-like protein
MGLSRRQFTKEFKLAAIERLEMGASFAAVARAFEVNPNVLHRWRRGRIRQASLTRKFRASTWQEK